MEIKKVGPDKVGEAQIKDSANISKTRTAQQADATKEGEKAKSTSASEHVKWSPEATMLQEGVQAAREATTSPRAERVKELKEAIRNGTYKPDPAKVADSMIQSSLEEAVLGRKV